ncbi:glutamate--tRNA ligase family protein, partial [Staphylococcus aureus]|uniref:glutamate--tRNA ligase family protein n=1 Tax=Staphylococcus aureus TaxID=1280 RepID=UPI001C92DDDE
VDHHYMQISHLIPPHHHISNTPKQIIIYQSFRSHPPPFPHISLILNQQPKNLTKPHPQILQFIHQYPHLPYLPQPLFNFIALLPSSP